MKDVAELYEKEQFEEIIDTYKDSKKYEEILYVLSSFLALNNIGGAYELYKKRIDVLEKTNFLAAMNYLLLIIALLNNPEIAKREFDRIKSLPYISQEVEEFIQDLDQNYEKIKAATIESSETNYNYIEELNSDKVERVLGAISYIHENFKDQINSYGVVFYEAFSRRENYDLAKNFLLLELLSIGFDKEISFFKNGKFYYLNPKEYQQSYNNYEKEVDSIIKFVKKTEKVTNLIDDITYYFVAFINDQIPTFYSSDDLETILYLSIRKAYQNVDGNIDEDEVVKKLTINEKLLIECENLFNNF